MVAEIIIIIVLGCRNIYKNQPLRNIENTKALVCLLRAFSARFSGGFRSAVGSISSNVKPLLRRESQFELSWCDHPPVAPKCRKNTLMSGAAFSVVSKLYPVASPLSPHFKFQIQTRRSSTHGTIRLKERL